MKSEGNAPSQCAFNMHRNASKVSCRGIAVGDLLHSTKGKEKKSSLCYVSYNTICQGRRKSDFEVKSVGEMENTCDLYRCSCRVRMLAHST